MDPTLLIPALYTEPLSQVLEQRDLLASCQLRLTAAPAIPGGVRMGASPQQGQTANTSQEWPRGKGGE